MTKYLTEVVARAICKAAVSGVDYERGGVTVDDMVQVVWQDWLPEANAAIAAHKAHLSASEYVIVPREPTEAMYRAGESLADEFFKLGAPVAADSIWHRMLSALPDKEG